jgi:hypothetical protein
MIEYPVIQRGIRRSEQIYAFDKIDGSNVRAEWSKKRGFYKFGTRKRLMDETDPKFGKAKALILEKYAEDLESIFIKERQQKAVAFFEFHGPNSFAGYHNEDDDHTVTLFDVAYQHGILEPKDFIKKFGKLDVPPVLWVGNANSVLIDLVKTGQLEGMTFEGVVCKGKYISPGYPLMFKIKNEEWIQKLKENYLERFEELL